MFALDYPDDKNQLDEVCNEHPLPFPLYIVVSGKGENETISRNVHFKLYRCYYAPCTTPPPTTEAPTPEPRVLPSDTFLWSNPEAWRSVPSGWGGNYGNGLYGLPMDGDNVMIVPGKRVIRLLNLKTHTPPVEDLPQVFCRGSVIF